MCLLPVYQESSSFLFLLVFGCLFLEGVVIVGEHSLRRIVAFVVVPVLDVCRWKRHTESHFDVDDPNGTAALLHGVRIHLGLFPVVESVDEFSGLVHADVGPEILRREVRLMGLLVIQLGLVALLHFYAPCLLGRNVCRRDLGTRFVEDLEGVLPWTVDRNRGGRASTKFPVGAVDARSPRSVFVDDGERGGVLLKD